MVLFHREDQLDLVDQEDLEVLDFLADLEVQAPLVDPCSLLVLGGRLCLRCQAVQEVQEFPVVPANLVGPLHLEDPVARFLHLLPSCHHRQESQEDLGGLFHPCDLFHPADQEVHQTLDLPLIQVLRAFLFLHLHPDDPFFRVFLLDQGDLGHLEDPEDQDHHSHLWPQMTQDLPQDLVFQSDPLVQVGLSEQSEPAAVWPEPVLPEQR